VIVGDHVERAPTFVAWLAEIRAERSLGKKDKPVEQPQPVQITDQGETMPRGSEPPKNARNPKAHYGRLTGVFLDRVMQLEARIADWLATAGPQMPSRELERTLHAERYPEWSAAMESLTRRKAIKIERGTVTLIGQCLELPDPYPRKPEVRKQRPKRPLSAWVKAKIVERGGTIPNER
jgi:hypothetical protein